MTAVRHDPERSADRISADRELAPGHAIGRDPAVSSATTRGVQVDGVGTATIRTPSEASVHKPGSDRLGGPRQLRRPGDHGAVKRGRPTASHASMQAIDPSSDSSDSELAAACAAHRRRWRRPRQPSAETMRSIAVLVSAPTCVARRARTGHRARRSRSAARCPTPPAARLTVQDRPSVECWMTGAMLPSINCELPMATKPSAPLATSTSPGMIGYWLSSQPAGSGPTSCSTCGQLSRLRPVLTIRSSAR